MTLKRIAELAEVSVATVSKAFSGSKEVGEDTRNRIFDIAKKEGCFEKYDKGTHDRPVVAILVPEICSEYYTRIVDLLVEAFREQKIDTMLALTHFDANEEARLFGYFSGRKRVDGVIVIGSGEKIKNPTQTPLVFFGGAKAKTAGDSVTVDFKDAFFDAISILKENGHQRIAFIGEEKTLGKNEEFRRAMRKAGLSLSEEYIITENVRFEAAGELAMEKLLRLKKRPTALIAAYDYIAFGAIRAAKRCGVSIPEQLSIIGVDDLTFNTYLDVPLSSIQIHTEEICDTVVQLLLKKMNNQHYRTREKIIIRSEFIRRGSLSQAIQES